MGMFDYINYNGKLYQTKDTPEQCLELYEIRKDELWFKKVDRDWMQDVKDGRRIKEVFWDWVFREDISGDIHFYDTDKDTGQWQDVYIKVSNGKITEINKSKAK